MPDIVITEFMEQASIDRLRRRFDVDYRPDLHKDLPMLAVAVGGCRALIVRNVTRVDAALLAAAPMVSVVGRLGVGLDNIDLDACKARGITVIPATGANAISVAELAIGAMLVLLRGAFGATEQVRAGEWPRTALMGREINGKTLGLIGFGHVGSALASRAQGMGMKVIAHDPFIAAEDTMWLARGVSPATLDEVLARADVVSLHVPLTEQTRGMIDAKALACMMRDAILINTARGGIVDEAALADALKAERLAGAALDVFETEPLDPASPLAAAPNTLLMPHVGAMTLEFNARVCSMIAEAVALQLGVTLP